MGRNPAPVHCVGSSACLGGCGSRQLSLLPTSHPLPPIQLHPVYVAQHRLALLVKLSFTRDGWQGRPGLSGQLTVGFGGNPKGHPVLTRKDDFQGWNVCNVSSPFFLLLSSANTSSFAGIHSRDGYLCKFALAYCVHIKNKQTKTFRRQVAQKWL